MLTTLVVLSMLGALLALNVSTAPPAAAEGALTLVKGIVGDITQVGTNSTFSYQLDLSCSSNTDNCGVVMLTDELSEALEFVDADTSGTGGWGHSFDGPSNTVTFFKTDGSEMDDGDAIQVFLTVRVLPDWGPGDGDIVNIASAVGDNDTPVVSSAPVTVTVVNEPLWAPRKAQISPAAPLNPAIGAPTVYRVQFCGPVAGNVELVDMELVDQLPTGATVIDPDGGTYDGGADTITWPLPAVSQADLGAAAAGGASEVCSTFTPTIQYNNPPFPDGTDITNTASGVDGPAAGDGTGVCAGACVASVDATVVTPDPQIAGSKSGDATVSANGLVTYSLAINTNGSNVALDDPLATDILPAGLRLRGTEVPNVDFGIEAYISTTSGASWTLLVDHAPTSGVETYGQTDFDTALTGTDNVVNAIEFRLYELDDFSAKVYMIGPGESARMRLYVETDKAAAPAVGADVENCVDLTSSTVHPDDGAIALRRCRSVEVTADMGVFGTNKTISPTAVLPGEEQTVLLEFFANSNNATPLVDPVLFDLLPTGFDFVEYTSTTTRNSPDIDLAPDPNLEVIEDFMGTGRTLVRFTWGATPPAGATAPDGVSPAVANSYTLDWTLDEQLALESFWDRHLEVRFVVAPAFGTPTGVYENLGGGATATPTVDYCSSASSSQDDGLDLDNDGVTTDKVCTETADTNVTQSAALAGFKWDDGLDGLDHVNVLLSPPAPDASCPQFSVDPDFTRFPCAAQTLPGETFPYTIEVFNQGNVPLTDYWLYDILPHVGDVGVNEALFSSPRNSEWAPQLTGPVTLSGLPGGNSDFVIEYSKSYNPCRDEVANPSSATPWPAGCVNDWTARPDNWLDVKSFRLNVPFDVAPFAGAESFLVNIVMVVPPGIAFETIAWNSFAHRATNDLTDTPLLPAAPRIVGIRIPGTGEFDASLLPFDQALIKTLNLAASTDLADGVDRGDRVTFNLELANQGRAVQSISVVDYIDATFFEDFALVDNPGGVAILTDSGDGDTFTVLWDATDPSNPVALVTADTGDLAMGESVTLPVTLQIADDWDGSAIVNWAEISNFDDDANPVNGDAADLTHTDDDSTPNTTFGDDNRPSGPGALGDDFVGGDGGAGGDPMANDEDDHDVAGIPVWDLALIKELGAGQGFQIDTSPATPTVTWSITVKNQGGTSAYLIDVIDTIPTGMEWASFDGVTAGTAAVSSSASAGDTATAGFQIDALAADEAVTFEFTMNVTDVAAERFLNIAEISGFDDDSNPSNADHPLLSDLDSTPDIDPTNDPVLDDDDGGPDGDVNTPDIDPNGNHDDNSHNDVDFDHDIDGNVNEPSDDGFGGILDEDDHGQELVVIPFDQALRKTFAKTSGAPLVPGTSTVTFDLEITQQGRDIQTISIVDYIDVSLWETFDAALNPDSDGAGVAHLADSGDADVFSYSWDATDSALPVVTLTAQSAGSGQLDFGETITVPITLTIAGAWDGSTLENWAEISNFDPDTNPANGDAQTPDGVGEMPTDRDSTPDTTIANDTQPDGPGADGDDVITGDGDGVDPVANDEDDHDVAGVPMWDLALINELGDGQAFAVNPTGGVDVTWSTTVTNQGMEATFNIDVTNTIATGMEWVSFDGVTAGTAAVTSTAVAGDVGATTLAIDALAVGESVTFEFTTTIIDLTAGEYLNIAEISAFDDTADTGDPANPLAVDVDSTPDVDPGNDAVLTDPGTDPNSNDDRNSHNQVDYDHDRDGNLNEPSLDSGGAPIDEDDHGQELVVLSYDLALTKVVDAGATSFPLAPGSAVRFTITVINQGRAVEDFTIADYIDTALWNPFDSAANADGTTGGDVALAFTWQDADGAKPVASIEGALAAGQQITLPITLTIRDDYATAAAGLENWAEIASFDDDGDAGTAAPTDLDSTPDDDQANDNQPSGFGALGDDEVDGDGDGSDPVDDDEDDHDVAGVGVLDLALYKTLNPATVLPVVHGATVTFDITIINQGSVHATDPTVIDYVDLAMWNAFAPGENVDGTTTGNQSMAYTWTTSGTDGLVSLTGTLAPGESVVVPVTLTIEADADLSALVNIAEIASVVPTDATGTTTLTYPDGSALTDIDSTPDTTVGNDNQPAAPGDPTDNTVDNSTDAAGDRDEDDHDLATVTPPTYSLGNQVWYDPNDNGIVDAGELGVDGVIVELYRGDTLIATTTTASVDLDRGGSVDPTTEAGLYLFDDLAPGDDYVVVITAANFADGAPLHDWVTSTPTMADPTDGTDGDDNGFDVGDAVHSGLVTVESGSPTGEVPDNDDETADGHENLTVDFGFTRYSIGNMVWIDADNNGLVDADEAVVPDVWVELFTDDDADGLADDRNDDGVIDTADAIATSSTDADGLYLFDGLPAGGYVVGIPPMEWDPDGPLYGYLSSDPTSADPTIDNDDNGVVDLVAGYVFSGPVVLMAGQPLGEDPDNDAVTVDGNENLTVDFGFWQPRFDLALRKRLADGSNTAEVSLGDSVTFTITVINQGDLAGGHISLIDYLPSGMELDDPDWSLRSDGAAEIELDDIIAPGEEISVDITVTIIGINLINEAEISGAVPIDDSGEVIVMPDGRPLPDIDSAADDDNSENPVDDEVDGANGDEDDHDVAVLTLAAPPPAGGGGVIAFSGLESIPVALFAMLLIAMGAGLVFVSRRRDVPPARHAL